MGDLFRDYLPYLLGTWAIEIPILVWVLRPYASPRRCVGIGLLASGITHPLLFFAWPRAVPRWSYDAYLASGEALVWIVEAGILWALALRGRPGGLRSASLASIAANAASCGVGLLLAALAGR